MIRFLKSEVGAVVLWVLCALIFGAAIAPWLYGCMKEFAMIHGAGEGILGSLAASCERAKFSRYFNRSLIFSAVLLLWPLWLRLKILSNSHGGAAPMHARGMTWRAGLPQLLIGLAAAGGLLWLLGHLGVIGGVFVPKFQPMDIRTIIKAVVIPTIAASLLEEWLFRGLLFGLWLRIGKPWHACIGTSLVFSFVHFLNPPDGVEISDPRAWHAGFHLVALILLNFTNPAFLTAEVLTLFLIGLSLAWARWRSSSLWLPIGMHAGWIFAYKLFNLTHAGGNHDRFDEFLIGDTLKSGLFPVVTIMATWGLVAVVIRRFAGQSPDASTPSKPSSKVT